jgi:2-polyprenyl-6-methoxyphenol hydroxylase-like FAD-dependent oxidoreductase
MREFAALGLQGTLKATGVENKESAFFNRFGQLLYHEPRGKHAGYPFPEVGIHRGRLHAILYRTVLERLGPDSVVTGARCVGFDQDADGVSVHLRDASGAAAMSVRADIAVACDGVNSTVRKQFYRDEKLIFTGINAWRGVSKHKPIWDGRTYMRVGSIRTGKIVIYPIADDVDGEGNQLINWTTEFEAEAPRMNDWNKPGKISDFIYMFQDWHFDWLDVAQLIRDSDVVLEYPMCDKDPILTWTFGRVTLAGDAAHPMYPRGSNGSAQAVIDARVLADFLAAEKDPLAALKAYETARAATTAEIVRTNRAHPPDFINIKVEELTGDKPFDDLDKYISQDELRALSDGYKRVAGFSLSDVKTGTAKT